MAFHNDSSADVPAVPTAPVKTPTTLSTPRPRRARSAAKPARSLAILAMVTGLVATVALPAYAAWSPAEEAMTMQDVAENGAQSLVVASAVQAPTLDRESYSATSQEEIDKKKAEEAAAERARVLAEEAAKAAAAAKVASSSSNSSGSSGSSSSNSNYGASLSMVAPGSGAVRWPVASYTYTEINTFRPPSRPSHDGFDMLASAGSPIFAAADGVVRVSQESFGGYGVAVTIDSVIGGQSVSTLYGHMIYGSRQVSVGQTVSAGQVIGLVGSTGRSTANHLHFEVRVGGGLVNPLPWLQANAG